MRFATAASAAIADGRGAFGMVSEPGGRAGGQLTRLKNDAGADKICVLIRGTAGPESVLSVLIGIKHKFLSGKSSYAAGEAAG